MSGYDNVMQLAEAVLVNEYPEWQTVFQLFLTDPDRLLDRGKYADFNFAEVIEDEEESIILFYHYACARGAVEQIDWHGEEDEGQLATFIASRMKEFGIAKPQERLIIELEKVIGIIDTEDEDGELVLEKLARIHMYLQPKGLSLGTLNMGWDSHVIFVVRTEDMDELLDIKDTDFSIESFEY